MTEAILRPIIGFFAKGQFYPPLHDSQFPKKEV